MPCEGAFKWARRLSPRLRCHRLGACRAAARARAGRLTAAAPASQKVDAAQAALRNALGTLDRHLKHSTYLAAHRVTLADIVASCTLLYCFKQARCPSPGCQRSSQAAPARSRHLCTAGLMGSAAHGACPVLAASLPLT